MENEKAVESLHEALDAIAIAKATAGKPGGLSNKIMAEALSAVFLRDFGPALVDLLQSHASRRPSSPSIALAA